MAEKLNAAKRYLDITDCWHVHYKCTRTFQASLSSYDGVDRQIEPYCCHYFHECRIERAHIYELLKLLNICRVFVYHTVKLILNIGGVSDHKRSDQPRVIRILQVVKAVRSRFNRNPVRKKKKRNECCAENHELHYQTRIGTWGFQMINRTTPYCCIK